MHMCIHTPRCVCRGQSITLRHCFSPPWAPGWISGKQACARPLFTQHPSSWFFFSTLNFFPCYTPPKKRKAYSTQRSILGVHDSSLPWDIEPVLRTVGWYFCLCFRFRIFYPEDDVSTHEGQCEEMDCCLEDSCLVLSSSDPPVCAGFLRGCWALNLGPHACRANAVTHGAISPDHTIFFLARWP